MGERLAPGTPALWDYGGSRGSIGSKGSMGSVGSEGPVQQVH
jgi:hypothetical protein